MKLKALAIRDRKLNAFHRPIFVRTIEEGIRIFADEARNPEGQIGKHPEDYELYHIGEYDDENAEYNSNKPHQIALADQFKTAP